jgi:hypothetical protein
MIQIAVILITLFTGPSEPRWDCSPSGAGMKSVCTEQEVAR